MYNPVEYFDEMNILKDDKLRRKKTAKEFINALVDFFAAQFLNLISGIFLYEKTSADYENELMDLYFAMMPEYQYETEVREKAYRFAKYIQEATERAVANANGNDDYKTSRMTGGLMKEEDVPKSVKRMFSEVRATEIALNETNWIYNWINHQNLVDKKQTTHTCVSMRDERVRVSHWEAEAKAEQQAQRDAYVKELEKFKAVAESSERYLGMGMPAEMAKATATAEYEGSMDVVTGNITKFMAERDKQKESEIRAQYLAQMPTPQSGNVGQVDYSAQIKQAMDAGDSQAAILAILNQSAANNQQA